MANKFKAIFKRSDGTLRTIKVTNTRDEAVDACVNYNDDYCLDSKKDRIDALEYRDFYVIGCGPTSLIIEEIEE